MRGHEVRVRHEAVCRDRDGIAEGKSERCKDRHREGGRHRHRQERESLFMFRWRQRRRETPIE